MNESTLPQLRVLHYLVCSSHRDTVAHCLDLDLVVDANNPQEAIRRLNVLVKAHVWNILRSGNFASLSTPAPVEYWRKYMSAKDGTIQKLDVEIPVPQVLPIEVQAAHVWVLAAQCAG